MPDLSDYKRGQIVGARKASVSLTKTAESFGVVKTTVSKLISAFETGQTSALKQNSRRKQKLSDVDRRTFTRIVTRNHQNTAPKITVELRF